MLEGVLLKVVLAVLKEAVSQEIRTAITAFQVVSAIGRTTGSLDGESVSLRLDSDCSDLGVYAISTLADGLPGVLADKLVRARSVPTAVRVNPSGLVVSGPAGVRASIKSHSEPLVERFVAPMLELPEFRRIDPPRMRKHMDMPSFDALKRPDFGDRRWRK